MVALPTLGVIPSCRLLPDPSPRALPAGTDLHVSGCGKGCAHPGSANVTLVGRPDGYGLVIDGRAGDTPQAILRADQLEMAVGMRQG